MTSDAAEVVRELAAAINGDDVQGLARLLDPEVVQYGTRGGVDQGRVIRGREAALAYWDEIGDTWERQTFEPEQLIEADGVVVALWQETVRIRDSQSDITSSTASLIKVRDGKVIEMRGYMDPTRHRAPPGCSAGLDSGPPVGEDGGYRFRRGRRRIPAAFTPASREVPARVQKTNRSGGEASAAPLPAFPAPR